MEIKTNFNLDSRSIPGEHSNRSPISFQQIEDDEDYFVYKLDPNHEKWARWDILDKNMNSRQASLGLQISDTIKNSYIHVFPDRQDLVNPAIISHFRHHKEFGQHHYLANSPYIIKEKDIELKNSHGKDNHVKNDKNKLISKVLPTSILEDSVRNETSLSIYPNKLYEMNIKKRGKSLKNPFLNSPYQSYSKETPQNSVFINENIKESFEEFSEIVKSKTFETANFDESDDMSFALVIKTLEKNISRSKAIRKYIKSNNQQIPELMIEKISSIKKQDDTLSLEQSSGVSNISTRRNPLYQEPKDLRTQFLSSLPEGNNTIYYSFASNHQESFSKNSERICNNFSKNFNKKTSNLQNEKDPLTTKELELKLLKFSPLKNSYCKKGQKLELAQIEEEIPGLKTPFQQKLNVLINTTKYKNVSNQGEPQILKEIQHLLPKLQSSENYILCINCNDLLPAGSVDIHSVYCNENMLAHEDLSKALVMEPEDILSSLEKCNERLKELKELLEKNARNLRGQLNLGLIQVNDSEIIFSDMSLILQIIEEIIRNKKVPYKLIMDTRSISNLKDDLSLFIDVTLVAVMISNLEIVLNICQQKKFVVELIQKQDYYLSHPLDFKKDINESFLNNETKKPLAPKYDLEKLRFSSLTSPQSASSNPISHSHKPSFPTSTTQSTRGSAGYSRRMPVDNRFLLGSDMKN